MGSGVKIQKFAQDFWRASLGTKLRIRSPGPVKHTRGLEIYKLAFFFFKQTRGPYSPVYNRIRSPGGLGTKLRNVSKTFYLGLPPPGNQSLLYIAGLGLQGFEPKFRTLAWSFWQTLTGDEIHLYYNGIWSPGGFGVEIQKSALNFWQTPLRTKLAHIY